MTINSLSEVDSSKLLEILTSAILSNPSDTSPNEVVFYIESSLEELRDVLTIPPKSDVSRQVVKTGEFERFDDCIGEAEF